MLIKMGTATEEVIEKGITLHQAAGMVHTAPPALLAQLSASEVPVRVWYSLDRTSLLFAATDIRAFGKVDKGFYLAPEEVAGARRWLEYVAQTTVRVPEFSEVYGEDPGHTDCTFGYEDAVFWASMRTGGLWALGDILKGTTLPEGRQKHFLTQIKAFQEVAAQFYLSETLSPFDAPCISLLDLAQARAAESRVLSTTPDYLTETLEAVEGVCPLLTAFISGDVATIRGFVAESVALGKSGEYELAKHIAEEELPGLPQWQVDTLRDGVYGFPNPLWVYHKALESFCKLVMRFT